MSTLSESAAVILAAGLGTRMKSKKAKVRHAVLGIPLVVHVAKAALAAGAQSVVLVVGHQAEEVEADVRRWLPDAPLSFVLQAEQLGTGHAVLMAEEATQGARHILVLNGDVPGLTADSLTRLATSFEESGGALSMATSMMEDPAGYGRMVRNDSCQIQRVVEHRDASETELAIREINVGLYLGERELVFEALHGAGTDNAQGEVYLTDVVPHAVAKGHQVGSLVLPEGPEIWGINNRLELARVEKHLRARINEAHMLAGVAMTHPETVSIAPDVTIGPDTMLRAGVRLDSGAHIGSGCLVDEVAVLANTTVGDGVHIKPYCVIQDSVVGNACQIGPFAHLRPGTNLSDQVKVGNFVEMKKAHLGLGSKASHLSYLGDCELGEGVNVGAGTITCNYDGVNKFKTVLEDGVFIGSDTQLVAPVRVGKGAFVGAGTTVTQDVPAGSLAISRTEQKNIEGWVARKKEKQSKG